MEEGAMRFAGCIGIGLAMLGMTGPAALAQSDSFVRGEKTRHVVHVMIDGLRWQEVFRGMDEGLVTEENKAKDAGPVRRELGGASPEDRRAALMPFLWVTMAKEGQVFGNQDKGSVVKITNPYGVSYPGYSE